jgi:hypothetical protein
MNSDTFKLILDVTVGIASLGWLIVGLKITAVLGQIRLAQLKDRTDLLAHQSEVKEALTAEQTKIKESLVAEATKTATRLDVHTAEDIQKFDALGHSLTKIDTKLDGLTQIVLNRRVKGNV